MFVYKGRCCAPTLSSERTIAMSFTTWIQSLLSHRGKAISLYRSGMAKANERDYEGAIADYSAAIEMPKIPADVRAMAIYNRALAYSAIDDEAKSVEDLSTLLDLPGVPENIRTAVQQRRERLRRRSEKADSP
jgi:tetratricopeptide (TPR) repeat protein